MEIDHVVLWVEDARRALDFYRDVVGLEGVRVDEYSAGGSPFPSVRISPGAILDLMPAMGAEFVRGFTGEKTPTGAGKPINHVCLSMSKSEFEGLAGRLLAAKVDTTRIGDRSFGAQGNTKHWFYFQDPDGNVIEARWYE